MRKPRLSLIWDQTLQCGGAKIGTLVNQFGLFGCKQNKLAKFSPQRGHSLERYWTAHRMNGKMEKTGLEPGQQEWHHPLLAKMWTSTCTPLY